MKTLLLAAAAATLAATPALADHGPKKDAHAAHGAKASHAVMLKSSSPANRATVSGSPSALTLTFAHPITLKTVALTGPDGKTVAVPVSAADAAVLLDEQPALRGVGVHGLR